MKKRTIGKSLEGVSFKVRLINSNSLAEFEIIDKEEFLISWRKRELVEFTKPNGDIFSHDLGRFYSMEIQELKELSDK